MATVKGDVHDIGKNIVAVVLRCNNYEVEDLGVMTPAETILDTAKEMDADLVGLSGLITPSLDEMVHVASEMERRGFDIPLLIGGATTSKAHTAVKVAPAYSGPTVYVTDASRAVGVASNLLSDGRGGTRSWRTSKPTTARCANAARGTRRRPLLDFDEAVENAPVFDWSGYAPPVPREPGVTRLPDYPLGELVEYIDWTPFFHTWGLAGRFPGILSDASAGTEARRLHDDATDMLGRLVDQGWLSAHGVLGLWPANSVGGRHPGLEGRLSRGCPSDPSTTCASRATPGQPSRSLADYVGPSGTLDYVGAFVVAVGGEMDAGARTLRGRRLLRNHAEGPRRPLGRSVRGAACTSGCARSSGASRRTSASTPGT